MHNSGCNFRTNFGSQANKYGHFTKRNQRNQQYSYDTERKRYETLNINYKMKQIKPVHEIRIVVNENN